MKQLAIVGDVHGEVDRLEAMLGKLSSSPHAVVMVGDYVNGGAHSREVLDLLASLRHNERYTFLLGNHDLALLDFVRAGNFVQFAALGGATTVRSYLDDVGASPVDSFRRAIPEDHLAFLFALQTYVEDDEILISHAGFNPADPADRSLSTLVAGKGRDLFSAPSDAAGKLAVCGHYVQASRQPLDRGGLICVDTGCGRGGPLTAVLLPERVFIQV